MKNHTSNSIVWIDGKWHDGDQPVMSAMSQSYMHGSTVFDGARAYNNCVPDLDKHCARLLDSARFMGLKINYTNKQLVDLCIEGVKYFEKGAELYIRPSIFANSGFLVPDPDSSKLVITLFRAPMPPKVGFTAMISKLRRPDPDMAPTMAKASCLYANTSRALKEAHKKGFDNVVMRDGEGNVAEFGSANLFAVYKGKLLTPVWNKTFLNGITKKRLISLFDRKGIEVEETFLSVKKLLACDEVFSTGNFGKVLPVIRVNNKKYEIGKNCIRAMELYSEFAVKSILS